MKTKTTIKQLHKFVQRYNNFLVTTHVNPDPDALSSQLVVGAYLRQMGKRFVMLNEEPLQERYAFLPHSKAICSLEDSTFVCDAAIVVDCGDLERVGKVKEVIGDRPILNIDHHITNDFFGQVNIVDAEASSTCELLFTLLKELKFKHDKNTATLIYTGMMTDTGSFRYENTTSQTHEIVAQLMKFKFSIPDLYRQLYENIPLNDLKAFSRIINNFETFLNDKVVCVSLPCRLSQGISEEFDLKDAVFKFLRSIKGVEVFAILSETDKPRVTRVNLRSAAKVNVAAVASHFGGGGHKRASGCMIDEGLTGAKTALLKVLKKVI